MTEIVEMREGEGQVRVDASDGFVNLEDRGSTLFVRVKRTERVGSVPVVIGRAALEEHFAAGKGEKDLAQAYLANRKVINAKVLELAPTGDVYTDSNPMLLGAGDFE